MWCEGVVWFHLPQSWTIRREPLWPINVGNLLSIWATVPLRKIWTYKKKPRLEISFFFALSCTTYSEDSMKNTTAITELKQCFGLIRQKPSRFIWRIFFLEIVTPFTVVKRKDCHKLWAYARSPQTPRCGWRRPDLECQNLLWGLSYWIPFFWQTAVFWIPVMRSERKWLINGGGGTGYLRNWSWLCSNESIISVNVMS